MTSNQVQPSAATSPFVSSLQVDAWGSVLATDANLTDQQRAIVLGTSIPLVFAKEVAGDGGAWVTPPAARYGAQANVTTGVTVSMGLVLSDGQIGTVAIGDVYKGAASLSALTSPAATFSYGSLPTSGFDYSLTTTTVKTASDFLGIPVSPLYSVTRNSILSFDVIDIRVSQGGTFYLFGYDLLVNGVVSEGTSISSSYFTSLSITRTFTEPTDVVLNIYQHPPGPYPANSQLTGEITHTYLSTLPATQETSEFPIFAGSGGSFSGLSCLSIKANYPLAGGVTIPADTLGEPFSLSVDSAFSITRNSTTKIGVDDLRVIRSGTLYMFRWEVVVNGSILATSGTTSVSSWSYSRSFSVESDVVINITPASGFVTGSIASCNLDYTSPGVAQGAASPLSYSDQVRCFIRNGIQILNLLSNTTESSSNFADIAYYLLSQCAGIPASLIDTAALTTAAAFTNTNQLFFNGAVSSQSNLRSYLQALAPFFLLRFTQIDGKFALVPLLPINSDGTFKTTAITPVKEFTNSSIIDGSYSRTYVPGADRRESAALVSWRNQSTSDFSVVNIAEIRYTGTASTGPYDKYDASEFCTSLDHAVLIGKYALATKKHITHSISFDTTIEDGDTIKSRDVIAVTWTATPTIGSAVSTRILYQIESVTDTGNGTVSVEALHFPANGSDQSLIALDLVGSGYAIQ